MTPKPSGSEPEKGEKLVMVIQSAESLIKHSKYLSLDLSDGDVFLVPLSIPDNCNELAIGDDVNCKALLRWFLDHHGIKHTNYHPN